jgi:hypothetical protein
MWRASAPPTQKATMMVGAVALSLWASPGHAQSGPFGGLAGLWSGSGTIEMSNGERERIRCRASYTVDPGGNNLRQGLRCASDSYRFDLATNVRHADGRISGSWSESTRGINGNLSGTVRGSEIRARTEGPGFAADLALSTRGDRQAIAIQATGGDIAEVSITLGRGAR